MSFTRAYSINSSFAWMHIYMYTWWIEAERRNGEWFLANERGGYRDFVREQMPDEQKSRTKKRELFRYRIFHNVLAHTNTQAYIRLNSVHIVDLVDPYAAWSVQLASAHPSHLLSTWTFVACAPLRDNHPRTHIIAVAIIILEFLHYFYYTAGPTYPFFSISGNNGLNDDVCIHIYQCRIILSGEGTTFQGLAC